MGRSLEHQAVIAQEIAMISREDNDSIVRQTQILKFRERPAYCIIDHGNHAASKRHGLQRFAFAHSKGIL